MTTQENIRQNEKEIFAARNQRPLRLLLVQALAILIVAYSIIVALVYSIPHLPLANGRTFHSMLRAQMTVDHAAELESTDRKLLLFLGSSVVERGIAEGYLDSLMQTGGITHLETSNSGNGGFFAQANLPMLRAMLERGLRPERVVYGFFLQEFNGRSKVHNSLAETDTTDIKLKEKSLLNVVRYGPLALSPLLKGATWHIYLFAANNAFREVHDPNAIQKLSFGDNMFERDSTYELNPKYVGDLEQIYLLCKDLNIPFAFFNTPVRPKIESLADLPYHRREESYNAVLEIAKKYNTPVWNYDRAGSFTDQDFQDTYHLTTWGMRKLTAYVFEDIKQWMSGIIRQDGAETLAMPSP